MKTRIENSRCLQAIEYYSETEGKKIFCNKQQDKNNIQTCKNCKTGVILEKEQN